MQNNLERLIKQSTPFKSPYIKAELGIIFLSNILTDIQQKYFKKHGITLQQYNVLRILRGQYPKPANINLIKDRMLDKMSDASRIVDRLTKLKLVSKQPNLVDKRNTDVLITDSALDLLTLIDRREGHDRYSLRNMSMEDIEQLNELLDRALGGLFE
ncbi:MAG: MarR family transcriptional regulator [Chitinophagaceae bacterium]|nr:MarR family transcriptional regulator [Chitinophagaceae bacterium]